MTYNAVNNRELPPGLSLADERYTFQLWLDAVKADAISKIIPSTDKVDRAIRLITEANNHYAAVRKRGWSYDALGKYYRRYSPNIVCTAIELPAPAQGANTSSVDYGPYWFCFRPYTNPRSAFATCEPLSSLPIAVVMSQSKDNVPKGDIRVDSTYSAEVVLREYTLRVTHPQTLRNVSTTATLSRYLQRRFHDRHASKISVLLCPTLSTGDSDTVRYNDKM